MCHSINEWFGLSYQSYFVIPRLALEAMPAAWQKRFIDLMAEAEMMGMKTPEYKVLRAEPEYTMVEQYDDNDPRSRDYIFTAMREDEWANYRRGYVSELCPGFLGEDNGEGKVQGS